MEQRQWYESYAKNKTYRVLIVEDESHHPIGYALIKNIDHMNRNAEIGMYLDPKAQGKRYGKDGFYTLTKFCFHELNMHRVYLVVFPFNERAVQLYKTLGFQIEGTFRDAYFKANQYHDIYIMAMLESEFQEK
jgi:RimJ/RimL family protein N-acetyltransferase